MISQGEAVRKLQGIIVSGPELMSPAEVILATIDAPDKMGHLTEDKLAKYTALYNEYMARDEEVEMSGEMAVEITEEAKERLAAIEREIDGDDDMFNRLLDEVQDFLFNSPFEGLDDQPYGLVEIATFAYLEYFASRELGLDHKAYAEKYRLSVADRSYEENANIHMRDRYVPLQNFFDEVIGKLGEDDGMEVEIAACAILAITGVKTPEMVGLILDGAISQGRQIAQDNADDIYVEGVNSLYDNTNRMMTFLRAAMKGIKEDKEN